MSKTTVRTDQYVVRNYLSSPVAITTRDAHYLIPGGTRNAPAEFPLTMTELTYLNSTSNVFKTGVLFFDPEDEEEVYEALRIGDWRDILRPDEIDDIILHPTTAKLERVLAIENAMYFDRIYGAYVSLKNTGHPIAGSVEQVMRLRKREFHKGIVHSEIKVSPVADAEQRQAETDDKIRALQEQIAALTQLLAAQQGQTPAAPQQEDKPQEQKPEKKAPAKPAKGKSAKGS